jgi:hypothetical protein
MKVRFSLPLLVCSLTHFFFTALLTVFFAGLLAGSLAVCGGDVGGARLHARPGRPHDGCSQRRTSLNLVKPINSSTDDPCTSRPNRRIFKNGDAI